MNSKKKILILNGSFCEQPLIEKSKEMEFTVITTGNAPTLIGHSYADDYIPCDYSDCEAILKLVKENAIDGIISCANDFGVLTASYVAEKMGWQGPDTYENAKRMHHKNLFKEYCMKNAFPSPKASVFTDAMEALSYCEQKTQEGCDDFFPIIVKANDLTGGKGIHRANNLLEAKEAISKAFAASRDKHILIEQFIIGTQHTFEAFIIDKKVVADTGCNCYSWRNPYLIQAETFPADGRNLYRQTLIDCAEKLCQDLNLRDGILAFQYIVRDGKFYIIEMMRRPFGNDFLTLCSNTTGFDMVEGHIRSQLGMDCTCLLEQRTAPKMIYCGHFGIMAPKNGEVKNFYIPQHIASHVYRRVDMLTEDMIQNGKLLTITDCEKERVSYIFYRYDNKEEMEAAVRLFNDEIVVEMGN